MKTEVYNENILHVIFKTQKEMSLTMCRLAEFYESRSKKLQGKKFTFEQLIEHYADDDGNFSYLSDWSGFNITGEVVDLFFRRFDSSAREKRIQAAVRRFQDKSYSVIASTGDADTLKHELAHAFYHLDSGYRRNANSLIRRMRPKAKRKIASILKSWGYSPKVMNDEINAYMATSSSRYLNESFGSNVTKQDAASFRVLYRKTSKSIKKRP